MFPRLREANYGSNVKARLNYQAIQPSALGPSDLLHVGVYAGATSSQFNSDDFMKITESDGYIGYYHFINGINHKNSTESIEKHIFQWLGIEGIEDQIYRSSDEIFQNFFTNKNDIIITYCSYNIFSKHEFRLKLTLTPGSVSKKTFFIDKSYQIIQNNGNGLNNSINIAKISQVKWTELNCSLLIRLYYELDRPFIQLSGLVSLNQFDDHASVDLLVSFLGKGYLTDSDPFYGLVSSCSTNSTVKTNTYRNRVVDTLIRIIYKSETLIESTIEKVTQPYLKIRLYNLPNSPKTNKQFTDFIGEYFASNNLYSTQSCLILLEQIKFLLSNLNFELALKLAQYSIKILPLDFECWFYLALTYALLENYEMTVATIDSFPVGELFNGVEYGIKDEYIERYVENLNEHHLDQPITEKTFDKYFPHPHTEGKIKTIWDNLFIWNSSLRHPINGDFYNNPLLGKPPKEISLVDSNLVKNIDLSILGFNRSSIRGRVFDLISFVVAKTGWDNFMLLQSKYPTKWWLDEILFMIVKDLKTLMTLNAHDIVQNFSSTQWEIMGLLGWNVKYSLKNAISCLVTANMNDSKDKTKFNYHSSVQLIAIYDEFISSEDNLLDPNGLYLNKLILVINNVFDSFTSNFEHNFIDMDHILFTIMKLVSWELRWYQFVPSYLVTSVLSKLVKAHSKEYVLAKVRILFNDNLTKTKKTFFSTVKEERYFDPQDTIVACMEELLEGL